MSEAMKMFYSVFAGMLLGGFYFWGLWYTVRKLPDSPRPFRLVALSFIIRAGAVLTGFYFLMGGWWLQLVAALLGFILIRELSVRRLGQVFKKA
jgi:F1F0 ATPase subunit 2